MKPSELLIKCMSALKDAQECALTPEIEDVINYLERSVDILKRMNEKPKSKIDYTEFMSSMFK